MSQFYYSHHIFMCQNVRTDGRDCCNSDGRAGELRQYAKDRAGEWGLKKPGGVRVNQAGCLGRCSEGPCMVIYPEGIWYRYQSAEDIDEILFEHIMNGEPVTRLRLDDE
ncbi:(2Fe-2S) ferredoxin domain-containing protein [Thiohalorhabdus sp. Cl-TMA]|uniref:Ferredoxin n=1 Tax=Thiohalorhabdus methylotrophus TaxID=3242694 RepID=A0ABV4TSX9_9GAMM